MKDCFSTLAFSRKTPYGWSGAPQLRIVLFSLLVYLAGCPAFAASMQETVNDCAEIVGDFSRIAERSIPPRVLRSAKGIAILRVLKGGFFVSGRIGEGVVIARLPGGGWSGPSAIGTGGAGFGFQVGGQVTEFVIILNTRAAEAGILPVAAVYTYSRSQGLFAGASLEGTILLAQSDKNARYYGGPVTPEQILSGSVAPPPSASQLVAALSQY